MIAILIISLAAALFAAASWIGTLAAKVLCAGRMPFEDGPQPVAFRRWPFALAGGCIGAVLAAHGAPPAQLAVLVLVVFALAGGTAADLACGVLPDVFTLGPLALIVGLGFAAHDVTPALGAAFAFAPFAAAAIFSRGRGMGWGDVKLAALGGALLGARDATLAFTLAAVAAYVIARRTGGARRPIAFGPYLAASIVATLAAVRIF
jgi:prepilin signal peptidase PulO-like enzyme (type II secretory pathway)